MKRLHDGQNRYRGNTDERMWYSTFDAMKNDLDTECCDVGQNIDGAIQYRLRNVRVPTLFQVQYEERGGRYRLAGTIALVTLKQK